MSLISKKPYPETDPLSKQIWDEQVKTHGRMTEMKQTLAHSGVALRALMEWYPLRSELVPVFGERAVNIFAHAISAQTDCLICSTFFRRLLIDAGENPDELVLNATESQLVSLGQHMVTKPHALSRETVARLVAEFSERDVVNLVTFGAIMVATNMFNNVLQVELDDYLVPYRKPQP